MNWCIITANAALRLHETEFAAPAQICDFEPSSQSENKPRKDGLFIGFLFFGFHMMYNVFQIIVDLL